MKKLSLAIVVLSLLVVMVGTAAGYDYNDYLRDKEELKQSGQMSTDAISHAVMDFSQIESTGSVRAAVYKDVYSTEYFNFTVTLQSWDGTPNKVTRFVFELTNQWRLYETYNTVGFDRESVTGLVYSGGLYKSEQMDAFIAGLPVCLENAPYDAYMGDQGDGINDGWIETYFPANWLPRYQSSGGRGHRSSSSITTSALTTAVSPQIAVAAFTPDSLTYTINGETRQMDVAPYIKNDRTYVPVRYLAYSLGVAEDGVAWSPEAQTVTITLNDTVLQLTIGSTTMLVNDEPVEMDVAPEIVSDRTFLPARWVAEALGATVEWDETLNQAVIIMPED
ncbi:MAG TPA: copper amine oxidase N-terminal domain-containing protein [Syntrophomonas sp.]|nr:copper amine oxidase N-terminal domain-containing protein [Syntrophomonas sp.]